MLMELSEEQAMLRDLARDFARKDIEPIATRIDLDETIPDELITKMAELGFFGLAISGVYGGIGQNLTTACLVLEEIARSSPAVAGMLSVEMVLCPYIVEAIGNDEQCRRLLPASARGERLMAYSITEPAGAVNFASHQTRLTAEGNNWRLNGDKLFCTQGPAKTYLVLCRTRLDGQEGMGIVIVDQEQDGFAVAPYEDKLGWRGTNTGSISFSDVLVTPDNVLGKLLTAVADHNMSCNQPSFVAHSAAALGGLQGMFDKTLAYVKERQLYGAPMYQLSPISDRLADIYNQIQAMRALLYTSSVHYDDRSCIPATPYGSICKSYICEAVFRCSDTLLQMWGGSGIMNSTGINRYFRDARANRIAEGATELHNSMISQLMLGLDLSTAMTG